MGIHEIIEQINKALGIINSLQHSSSCLLKKGYRCCTCEKDTASNALVKFKANIKLDYANALDENHDSLFKE